MANLLQHRADQIESMFAGEDRPTVYVAIDEGHNCLYLTFDSHGVDFKSVAHDAKIAMSILRENNFQAGFLFDNYDVYEADGLSIVVYL